MRSKHIEAKVEVLIKQLHARANETIDITKWTLYYTFDAMGIIAFSKDFNQLEDATEHHVITNMHAQLEAMGALNPVPWLLHLVFSIPGLGGSYKDFIKYSGDQVEQRKAVCSTYWTSKPLHTDNRNSELIETKYLWT